MLMEEEAVSDDINELTRISIEKLSSLDKKLIKNGRPSKKAVYRITK